MGWITTIACTLIAAMFVYNWFSRESDPASSTEEPLQRSPIKLARADPARSHDAQQPERPAPEAPAQPPVIITGSDSERSSGRAVRQNDTKTHPKVPLPPSITMPPPPPPPSTASLNPMPPPPRARSPPRLKPPTIGRPPTAPRPGGSALRPPPSAASSLRVPTTKVLSNTSMAPSSLMPPPKKAASKQVMLEPGHSPLDWAALTTDPKNNLRGKDAPDGLIRVTPSMLKAQNGRKDRDAWTVFQGKVYNITPYLPFHPGGKGELLRGAGKDSAKLFMEVHPWVNWDGMLSECCVGIFVSEEEGDRDSVDNKLDEMD